MIQVTVDCNGWLSLSGEATIHYAAELQSALVALRAERANDFVLDLGALTAIDTAGVQVLLAFRKSSEPVRVTSCPDPLRAVLVRGGLVKLLM